VANEEAVLALLEPHSFVAIQSEKLSLGEQIALFRQATHIVAPHGASLTNLLHARGGSVLELFQEGHGLRPDFFQLAKINGLDYLHALCPASGPEQHIKVSSEVLEAYLARTL
jgi:capsular polysaccharide biosynthesis protein